MGSLILRAIMWVALLGHMTACAAPLHKRPWDEQAQIALNMAAHAVNGTDSAITMRYMQERQRRSYDALAPTYEPIRVALVSAHGSLLISQHDLDAYRRFRSAQEQCQLYFGLQGVAEHVEMVAMLATSLGASASELAETVGMLGRIAGHFADGCESDGGAVDGTDGGAE
jgi:hypothetical protein